MNTCYDCSISFTDEGDPVDGNQFCSHRCSGNYINKVNQFDVYASVLMSPVGEHDGTKSQKQKEVQAKLDQATLVSNY